MILWLLLSLAATAHGASIPPQPVIPTASACLQSCFQLGSIVNAAFDLLNFRSIAVDIENFCNLNSALLKCGRDCPPEQIPELEARTSASSFVCSNKVEEFRLVSGCMEGSADVTAACASECGVPTDVPFRLDSSPAASVNPAVFLDGVAGTCKKEICFMKCSQQGLNKECAGAGDLFKDMARQQVRSGIESLTEATNDENSTTVHFMAENYLKNLPNECAFLKDVDEFEKALEPEVSTTTESSASSKMTTAEVILEKSAEMVTVEFLGETIPKMVEVTRPDAETAQPTSTHGEEHTTVVPVHDEGVVVDGDTTSRVTIELPEEEHEGEMKTVVGTTPVAEVTEEHKEATPEESKEDIGMDVNAVEITTTAEPVIVVDNTPDDADSNRVQVFPKQEKSNSATTLVFSSVLAAIAAVLVV